VRADRELTVVWAVAKGSALNKLILVPLAILISAIAPWAITPLLVLGGIYLCFEGVEKLAHRWMSAGSHHAAEATAHTAHQGTSVEAGQTEQEKIRGAIRTDFILSAEIIVIALGTVAGATLPVNVPGLQIFTRAVWVVAAVMLAWLVAGAVQWYRDSQVMPADPLCVLEATQRWRRNSDLLLRYIDDCVVFDSASHVVATELFAHFNLWLKNSGHREWSDQSFSNRLGQHSEVVTHGVEKKRGIRFTRPGLSRPPRFLATGGELRPDAFTAWLGLRFQNDREGRD
jgi:hypothetical protein